MQRLPFCIGVLLTLSALSAAAAHPFLCSDYGGDKVCIVSADGAIEWEYPAKKPQDCWRLSNGNILLCHVSGAVEVTRDKKVVWEYKAPEKTEVQSCQPLPDGRVLVVECGTSRLVEVDRAGVVAKEIKLQTTTTNVHNQFRGVRKTAAGHYLVTFKGEKQVKELDAAGKVLKSIPVAGDPHSVRLLPNDHLLIACGDGHKLIEMDANGKIVWELNENDLPNNPIRLSSGFHRLPNGNTIVVNWGGHGFLGKQPLFFEITRDKKVLWEFTDYSHFKSINQVQMLDVTGDPVRDALLR
jgi:hypothetical protein